MEEEFEAENPYFVLAYRNGPEGASNTNYFPKINRIPRPEEVENANFLGTYGDLNLTQLEEVVFTIADHRDDDSSLENKIKRILKRE